MDKDELINRITALCAKRGVTLTTAFTESGVGKNFKSNLKTAGPSKKNLYLLSKYFDVSIDYLTGDSDNENVPCNDFWDRFAAECRNAGKSPNPIAKELDISSGSVTAWKYGAVPNRQTLEKLSDYFGCTIDYLLGKTDERSPAKEETAGWQDRGLSGVEFAIYGEVRSLTESEQQDVLDYIRFKKAQKEQRK